MSPGMPGGGAPGAGEPSASARLPLPQRIALEALLAAVALVARLPAGLTYRLAGFVGLAAYLVQPGRRALARANLARVCRHLAGAGQADPAVAAAAADPRRLERLVRGAFRHWMVTYLESAVAPHWKTAELMARIEIDDPGIVARALGPLAPGSVGPIFVSLHFGSAELAGLYAARTSSLRLTGPMETVPGRFAAAWFERVRERYGVRIVPLAGAGATLRRALLAGEGAALVADRDITGDGTVVDFFGAPARVPAGPALLAAHTGAPFYVLALRRTRPGRWRARMVEIRASPGTDRRELSRTLLAQEVRAFESLIADAPAQWWTVLFRIWDDDAGRTAS